MSQAPPSPNPFIPPWFATLELPVDATPAEIRDRYKALAQRWHPDRAGGDAASFQRVQAAYDALQDPATREACAAFWKNRSTRNGVGAILTQNGWLMPDAPTYADECRRYAPPER